MNTPDLSDDQIKERRAEKRRKVTQTCESSSAGEANAYFMVKRYLTDIITKVITEPCTNRIYDDIRAHIGMYVKKNHRDSLINYNRAIHRLASEFNLRVEGNSINDSASYNYIFYLYWSLPSHYVRITHLYNAKDSTPLAKFLNRDGDHAIMSRVWSFEEKKLTF